MVFAFVHRLDPRKTVAPERSSVGPVLRSRFTSLPSAVGKPRPSDNSSTESRCLKRWMSKALARATGSNVCLATTKERAMTDVNLETFLYGTKAKPWWDEQHLLVIRYTMAGGLQDFDADHDAAYFRDLFLAEDVGAAAALAQLSGGVIKFTDVGPIVAPKIYTGVTGTTPEIPVATSESIRTEVITKAAQDIDFSIYDANGDGVVENEVMIVVVAPGLNSTSIVRATDPGELEVNGTKIRTTSIAFAENPDGVAKQALVAHEALHVIATMQDVYGPNDRAWNQASMASQFQSDYVQLDPMNKLCNGWVEPHIVDLANTRHDCFTLTAPGSVRPSEPTPRPVLLFDSSQGTNDFFLVEYRTPQAPASKPNFDKGLREHGVAVWRIRTDGANIKRENAYITNRPGQSFTAQSASGDDQVITTGGRPVISWGADGVLQTRPMGSNMFGTMPMVIQISPPDGVPALSPALWRSEHGPIPLSWAGGESTGFEIIAKDVAAQEQECTIAIGRSGDPYTLESDLSIRSCWAEATGENLDVSIGEQDQVLYAAKPDGSLVWYRHLARLTGGSSFANRGAERVIAQGSGGGGWASFVHLVSGGEGVLYGVKPDGSLVWYRHEEWLDGGPRFANRGGERVLAQGSGGGWADFVHVVSGGDGVLCGVKPDGSLVWYRHLSHLTGEPGFANGGGERVLSEGSGAGGWADFAHVEAG